MTGAMIPMERAGLIAAVEAHLRREWAYIDINGVGYDDEWTKLAADAVDAILRVCNESSSTEATRV